tara:strand:- start:156 stop:899 length:744 start_codon:yes stop_codon:yes gene_type:complete
MKLFLAFFLILFNSSNQSKQLVIGHRGAKGHVAENTLKSIKKAMQLGADGIEIDVFRCLSGEIVLFHDKKLDKLTNGTGLIENTSLEELKKLKVLGTNQQIPTLNEVFDVIDNKTFLNIELKGSNTAKLSLEIVKQQINNNGFLKKNILFSSFNWEELKDLRKLDGNIKIALITEDDPLLAIKPALNLRAVAINPSHKTLNKKVVEKIFSAGLKIYTWTVNNKKQIYKMKKLGVNGIITDYPERVLF